MRKFCRHCGKKLSRPGASFCPQCGKPQALAGSGADAPAPNAKVQLLIQQAGQPPRTFPLTQQTLTVGRDPNINDLHLDASFVSRSHAVIEQRNGIFTIHDKDSTNGLSVDGHFVESYTLRDGSIIRIGDQQGNSISLTFQQMTAASTRPRTISLSKLETDGQTVTIGRDPTSTIHLNHPAVSRHHAEMRQAGTGHTLRDLGSANRTFINGQPIGTAPLKIGDVVQIGPFKLVYDQTGLTEYAADGNYRLEAVNLRRVVTIGGVTAKIAPSSATEKVILDDISLVVQPKEFIALVGGSGAGKSTLMKAMSGFAPANEGEVRVNGDDLYSNFAAYRSILGYVPQDDIIHQGLTVRGALEYAAKLRLPDSTDEEIDERIELVLDEVELTDHQQKVIRTLSGGQRKRVSIAAELLAEPGLFFLDEPTSGLDPGLEKKMMATMRRLADAGRTIVLVTHATANISQCTHVTFLAEGHLCYYGPPEQAGDFFGTSDFADIYTQLSQTVNPRTLPTRWQPIYQQMLRANGGESPNPSVFWATCYKKSAQYDQFVEGRLRNSQSAPAPLPPTPPNQVRQRADLFKQFGVLARRYFELTRRDLLSMAVLLLVMPIIGLLLLMMADEYDLVGLPRTLSGGGGTTSFEYCEEIVEGEESAESVREHVQCHIIVGREDATLATFQGIYTIAGQTERVLFIMALAPTLLGIFAAAFEIVKEAPIYQRERMVNLRIWPYLFSKTSVLAVFGLLQCALFLLVLQLGLEMPEGGSLLGFATAEMFITLFLGTVAALSTGLFLSALVRKSGTVIYLILLVLFVQILFAGAIFEIPSFAEPISKVTLTRWTLEALGSTVGMDDLQTLEGGCLEPTPPSQLPRETICNKNNQIELDAGYNFKIDYSFENGSTSGFLLTRWLGLLSFAVVLHLLTYVLQKRKDVI